VNEITDYECMGCGSCCPQASNDILAPVSLNDLKVLAQNRYLGKEEVRRFLTFQIGLNKGEPQFEPIIRNPCYYYFSYKPKKCAVHEYKPAICSISPEAWIASGRKPDDLYARCSAGKSVREEDKEFFLERDKIFKEDMKKTIELIGTIETDGYSLNQSIERNKREGNILYSSKEIRGLLRRFPRIGESLKAQEDAAFQKLEDFVEAIIQSRTS
jgi:Fe-S-cluster containining protein